MRFVSARRKLARGRRHCDRLFELVDAFEATDPITADFVERDDGSGDTDILFHVHQDKVPVEMSLVLGDCLHNFRTALDHIVFHAVGEEATTRTEWPMAGEDGARPKDWEDRVRSRACRGRSAAASVLQDYLCGIEPFRGGRQEWMWLLHRLDVTDKHRLLLTATTVVSKVRSVHLVDAVQVTADEPDSSVLIPNAGEFEVTYEPPSSGALTDGQVFLTFTADEMAHLRRLHIRLGVGLLEPGLPVGVRSVKEIVTGFVDGVGDVIETIEDLVDTGPTVFRSGA